MGLRQGEVPFEDYSDVFPLGVEIGVAVVLHVAWYFGVNRVVASLVRHQYTTAHASMTEHSP